MNIYQKLHAVMQKVAYVKKDKTVDGAGGGYRAVTHDMVTAMVRQHFVDAGIIIVPRLVSGQTVSTGRATKAGTPINRFEGIYDVSFVNIEDPTDTFVVQTVAHADDQGDKAPGKALSYAVKGVILKVLMLETGEDDESRVGPVEGELSEEHGAILVTLRERAFEGTVPLKKAWAELGKDYRVALAAHLDGLKKAAAEADKEPAHA